MQNQSEIGDKQTESHTENIFSAHLHKLNSGDSNPPVTFNRRETPECEVCGKEMQLFARMDSYESVKTSKDEPGTMLAFYCNDCRIVSTSSHCA